MIGLDAGHFGPAQAAGAIGVKVWICKGEIFPNEFKEQLRQQVVEQRA